MQLRPAGNAAELDRYVGYWKPHAARHDELDGDTAIQDEVGIVARTLVTAIAAQRSGQFADVKPGNRAAPAEMTLGRQRDASRRTPLYFLAPAGFCAMNCPERRLRLVQ